MYLRDGIWIMDFQVGGERVHRPTGETSKRKAEEHQAEVKAAMKARKAGGHTQVTLAEAMKKYMIEVAKLGRSMRDDYTPGYNELQYFKRLRAAFGHDTLLDNINEKVINDWRGRMLVSGRIVNGKKAGRFATVELKDKGLLPGTINRYLECLRAVMMKAHHEWMCLARMPKFTFLKNESKKTRFLSDDEEDRLLAASPEHLANLLTFLLGTGARRSEALFLVWDDLNLSKNRNRGSVIFPRTKNGKERPVPLPDPVRDMLIELRARKPADQERVFLWKNGNTGAIEPLNSVDSSLHTALKSSKLSGTGVSLHIMRHTYASRLVQRGVPLKAVAELLGHKNAFRVTERYAHLSPSSLDNAIDVLDRKIPDQDDDLPRRKMARSSASISASV